MPPRKRPDSAAVDEPPAVRQRPDFTFSPLFNDVGTADLILRCSEDQVCFAVRRLALGLHSAALSFPDAVKSEDQGELPVVDLAHSSKALETFLRFCIPQAYLLDGSSPSFLPLDTAKATLFLVQVLEVAETYQCMAVQDIIVQHHLPLLIASSALKGWAVACRFKQLKHAQACVRGLASFSREGVGARRWRASKSKWMEGQRDMGLGDLDIRLLRLVSYEAISNFARLHSKVIADPQTYTWEQAGNDFELW